MNRTLSIAMLLTALAFAHEAHAVTGVNPSGVNVRQNGPTTVFLTFQNLADNERAVEAFWCSAVSSTGVSATNPCLPGTLLGRLPPRLDQSRTSGQTLRNLTDIMTIPSSVARRALRAAAREADGSFFYVRRFSNGINDSYVTVTCRMAGGGARSPLALTRVQMWFDGNQGATAVYRLQRGQTPPPVAVYINYNGSGRLKGRWEILRPGDSPPTTEDLLTEATLPVEQRARQKRYTLIQRFSHFLPPTGSIRLPGPEPHLLPTAADGPYQLLFRVEASADKEGDSNTLEGKVHSGGVAGFPMPVLRYFVGPPGEATHGLRQLSPETGGSIPAGRPLLFSWLETRPTPWVELQLRSGDEILLEATLRGGEMQYFAPPWLRERAGQNLRWRLRARNEAGEVTGGSEWRPFHIE